MPAKLFNNRWEREPDDFAATLSERDLAGFTNKNLTIFRSFSSFYGFKNTTFIKYTNFITRI